MRPDFILMLLFAVGIVVMSQWKTTPVPTHFGSTVIPMDYEPTDTFVRTTYVDGTWVGSAGAGGSAVAGGVLLPLKWHPKLTVVVKWERCHPYGKGCVWKEKPVLVHPYTDVGMTHLHIIDGDEVLIIASILGPGHADYPGPDLPIKNFHRKQGISRFSDEDNTCGQI